MLKTLEEEHAEEIQDLNMHENEHLLNEIDQLEKIISEVKKLKKKHAEEINTLKENLRISWELNDGLKKEIAELKSAVAGSAAGCNTSLVCHLQPSQRP